MTSWQWSYSAQCLVRQWLWEMTSWQWSYSAQCLVRQWLLGKDCACLSVVLVLSAIARVCSGYVFIGRDCACLFVILALVCQGCSHARCGARKMPGIDVQKTAEPRSCSSSIRSRRLCLTTETGTHSASVLSSAAWLVSPGQLRCSFWGPCTQVQGRGTSLSCRRDSSPWSRLFGRP